MDPSYDYISELLDGPSNKTENGLNGTEEPTYVMYVCQTCNTPYDKFSELMRHRKYDHNEHPFWCMICSMEFKDYRGLCAHVRVHSGVNNYQCILCGRSYMTHCALESHSENHMDKDKTPRLIKYDVCHRSHIEREQKRRVKNQNETITKLKTKRDAIPKSRIEGERKIPCIKNNSENGEFDFH